MQYGPSARFIVTERMARAAEEVVLDVQEKSFAISNPHWDDALC